LVRLPSQIWVLSDVPEAD